MSKMGKNETARYEGAAWYDRLIDRVGIEEAKKELEWRGALNLPLQIEKAEITRATHEIRQNCTVTICGMAVFVLMDEFDFKAPDIQRFINRFNSKTDFVADDIVSWPDIRQTILDEIGIDIDTNEILWDNNTKEYKNWKRREHNEGRY